MPEIDARDIDTHVKTIAWQWSGSVQGFIRITQWLKENNTANVPIATFIDEPPVPDFPGQKLMTIMTPNDNPRTTVNQWDWIVRDENMLWAVMDNLTFLEKYSYTSGGEE